MKHFILFLTLFFCSCNSKPDFEDYLKQVGITLVDNYKIIGYNYEEAIGDFSVNFQLKISDNDFQSIVTKIKKTENYGEYKSGEYPNSFISVGKDYQISGFKLADKYFYKKISTHEPRCYEIVLDAKKTLHFTFTED
ncbi:MAG TPA: hypothetical protein VN192_06750 [Flavobacterium sp.]|nr:hypothetical protein [Flavobacterium sp.]